MRTHEEHRWPDTASMVEGRARVVKVLDSIAWLEPEQTASCGGCAASSTCGAKGMGTLASRIEARAFTLPNAMGLVVGDQVVIGIREGSLVKGALIAYALPVVTLLFAGAVAQSSFHSDGVTMLAMFIGLTVGLDLARRLAKRLFTQGRTSLHFLRRVGTESTSLPWPTRSDA